MSSMTDGKVILVTETPTLYVLCPSPTCLKRVFTCSVQIKGRVPKYICQAESNSVLIAFENYSRGNSELRHCSLSSSFNSSNTSNLFPRCHGITCFNHEAFIGTFNSIMVYDYLKNITKRVIKYPFMGTDEYNLKSMTGVNGLLFLACGSDKFIIINAIDSDFFVNFTLAKVSMRQCANVQLRANGRGSCFIRVDKSQPLVQFSVPKDVEDMYVWKWKQKKVSELELPGRAFCCTQEEVIYSDALNRLHILLVK